MECCRISAEGLTFIFLIIYLIIGTFTFKAIESPNELEDEKIVNETIRVEVGKVLDSAGKISISQLVSITIDPNDTNFSIVTYQYDDPYKRKWNLPGSLFFVLSIVTTIGYGNLAPQTDYGKLCCVFFAIFGIPLYTLTLGYISELITIMLMKFKKLLTAMVNFLTGKCLRPHMVYVITEMPQLPGLNAEQRRQSITEAERKRVRYNKKISKGILFVIGYALMLTLPSSLFAYLESWDYLGALYYNFITLSTIGFGDMVAGLNRYGEGTNYDDQAVFDVYRIYLSCWIFLGLPFASVVMKMWREVIKAVINYLATVLTRLLNTRIRR